MKYYYINFLIIFLSIVLAIRAQASDYGIPCQDNIIKEIISQNEELSRAFPSAEYYFICVYSPENIRSVFIKGEISTDQDYNYTLWLKHENKVLTNEHPIIKSEEDILFYVNKFESANFWSALKNEYGFELSTYMDRLITLFEDRINVQYRHNDQQNQYGFHLISERSDSTINFFFKQTKLGSGPYPFTGIIDENEPVLTFEIDKTVSEKDNLSFFQKILDWFMRLLS